MSFTQYVYRIDVFRKYVEYDESGQSIEDWTLDRTIKCNFMPSRGTERLVGRLQNPRSYTLWVEDEVLDVSEQLRNLKDRYDNIIDEGPFNVTLVKKFGGFSRYHHSELEAQKVLE